MPEIGARTYDVVVGSDIVRDGVFCELTDAAGDAIAEVFRSDAGGPTTLTTYGGDVPLDAIEWMIEQARMRLGLDE